MKPLHFVIPAIALIGSAAWIYSQESPLRDLVNANTVIRERIARMDGLRKQSTDLDLQTSLGGNKTSKEKHLLPDGSYNWIAIGEMVKESEGDNNMGMGENTRLLFLIKEEIMGMSVETLTAELAKLPGLELDEKIRLRLKMALIDGLVQKDPVASFEMLEDDLPERPSQSWWKLKGTFSEWSKKDPTAAANWLDKMTASKKFEDKSLDTKQSSRFDLETELMATMIVNDPKGMAERFSKFTPEERVAILQETNVWSQRGGEVPKEFIELVRGFVTTDEKDRIIGNAVATSFGSGLKHASAEIEKHDLSAGERSQAVEAALRNLSYNLGSGRGDLEDIYPWLQKEDPERAVELTGEFLASTAQRRDSLEEKFERALRISEENGKPEIVQAMMENLMREDENLRSNFEKFSDESLKKQFESLFKEATGFQ